MSQYRDSSTVLELLIRDRGKAIEWCDLWVMKLNARKTKTMIVSWSHTMHPHSPVSPITYWQNCTASDDLAMLRVTFDSKTNFEKHLSSVSRPASQRFGIMRISSMIDLFFGNAFRVLSCPFWYTVLQCSARLPIHTLNYWTMQSVVPGF